MRGFLTDEQIPPDVAEQMREIRPDIRIESVVRWRDRVLRGAGDSSILAAAHVEGLALITYDLKTIPPLLGAMSISGQHHSGVVFVDQHSIRNSDVGGLIRAIIRLYDEFHDWDWTDRVQFLTPESV